MCLARLQGEVKVKKMPRWHLWSNTSFLPSAWRCESKASFIFFSFFPHFYFFCDATGDRICVAPKAITCFLIGQWTSKRILLDSSGFAKEIFGTDCKFGTDRGAIKIPTTFGSKLFSQVKTFLTRYLFMFIYLSMLQVINCPSLGHTVSFSWKKYLLWLL